MKGNYRSSSAFLYVVLTVSNFFKDMLTVKQHRESSKVESQDSEYNVNIYVSHSTVYQFTIRIL